ncbi:MAG: TonB-dependent receptor [Nevskia sp.]|nr:TonB-dependent receptor [Nevskia sp.]
MKLNDKGRLRLAVHAAFAVGVGVAAQGAWAQQAATDAPVGSANGAQKAEVLTGVQVTGTRIRAPNITSTSPVTSVDSMEIKYEGATRTEDVLNNLPQVFADQGSAFSNGSDGTAAVNLRGLGSNRTMVLIDGKRMVPGDPRTLSADVNFIPAGLIERVDVLTGGASAVYGADAVAGVVNFIMKKNFEGIQIDAQRSGYWHHNGAKDLQGDVKAAGFQGPAGNTTFDGGAENFTLLMGINSPDGKGNLTAYATYLHQDPVTQAQRDYGACSLGEADANNFACGGSSTTYPGRFITNAGDFTIDSATGNTFRDFNGATDLFNFGPYNYYQRNDERYTFGAFGHYTINEHFEPYTQLMFMDDRTDAVIAPSGAFLQQFSINCDNPLLSSDEQSKICVDENGNPLPSTASAPVLIGRRNKEGGGRDDNLRHTDYRIAIGLRGNVFWDWSYDASAQFDQALYSEEYKNDFSFVRVQRALNVVADPNTGQPVCASVVDGSDPNCVPWNIWQIGGVSPSGLSYLQTPGFQRGNTTQQVVNLYFTGPLGRLGLKSPLADQPLNLAFGGEYRREQSSLDTDVEFQTGDLNGQGGATLPVAGAYDVQEAFAELAVPIIQHKPFVESLEFNTGYRYSTYSTGKDTNTYKLELAWAPTRDVKFRGSYNRAVRAPNVVELFNPQSVALDGATDPCAGTTPSATAAQCANDPLIKANPGLYGNIKDNPAEQYNGLQGGNPNANPETAFTTTFGFVFTPTFVKDLDFTVDYYKIKIVNLIGTIGADTILSECYLQGNQSLCGLIHRDPNPGLSQGTLWLNPNGYVVDTTLNTGYVMERGIDFSANYRFRLSKLGLSNEAGFLRAEFVGTRLLRYQEQAIPGDPTTVFDCQGRYGSQCSSGQAPSLAPNPIWRHRLRLVYSSPWGNDWVGEPTFSVAWRHINGVSADTVTIGNTNNRDTHLGSRDYFDVYGAINVLTRYNIRLGINNVFDRDPPTVGAGACPTGPCNGNTYAQTYDVLGRYLYFGVTANY